MYREFFRSLQSTDLPLATMLFFLAAFVLVLMRTFVWKSRRDYDPVAALPLEEDGSAPRPTRQEGEP